MQKKLWKDLAILGIAILGTIALARSGSVDTILNYLGEAQYVGAFVAGIFFTSVFTVAPATLIIIKISLLHPPLLIALVVACGAVIGDLILFLFVRDRLVRDIDDAIAEARFKIKPAKMFKLEFLRWLNPLLGALVIASPLPDELGLALMGFAKISTKKLILISFVMNALGVLFIASVARSIF
jgi:uncharacterized membrane protein YdjX (TVP38/TMEM64 family)